MNIEELNVHLKSSSYPLEVVCANVIVPTGKVVDDKMECRILHECRQITKDRDKDGNYMTDMIDKWCDSFVDYLYRTHSGLIEINYTIRKY